MAEAFGGGAGCCGVRQRHAEMLQQRGHCAWIDPPRPVLQVREALVGGAGGNRCTGGVGARVFLDVY